MQIQISWLLQKPTSGSTLFAKTGHVVFSKRRAKSGKSTYICNHQIRAFVKEEYLLIILGYLYPFLHKNLCGGCSLEAPRCGTSNEYPQCRFLWRNKKNNVLNYHQILLLSKSSDWTKLHLTYIRTLLKGWYSENSGIAAMLNFNTALINLSKWHRALSHCTNSVVFIVHMHVVWREKKAWCHMDPVKRNSAFEHAQNVP